MLLLTYTQKVFYMYQSRLSLPSGSSRKSTQRARQRVFEKYEKFRVFKSHPNFTFIWISSKDLVTIDKLQQNICGWS